MGQLVWISGAAAIAALVVAFAASGPKEPGYLAAADAESIELFSIDGGETGYAESAVGEPQSFTLSTGSALATAAFGMAALHPDTYNGEIVLDLIKASPLTTGEKSRLKRQLFAADAGRADLSVALSDVRVALALE